MAGFVGFVGSVVDVGVVVVVVVVFVVGVFGRRKREIAETTKEREGCRDAHWDAQHGERQAQ